MKTIYQILLLITIFITACQSRDNSKTQISETKSIDSTLQTDMIPDEISVKDFDKFLSNHTDLIVLDVRTPEEISEGKIASALEIDFNADHFEAKIDQLDKDKKYLVYCKSGGRSSNSIAVMKKKGFKNCTNLKGGYTAYADMAK